MYQILCDGYQLYDPRSDELVVIEPKCSLGVNAVGSASFTILPAHPFYDKLRELRSVVEILDDESTIFRGRITGNTLKMDNRMDVDVEGALACANDTQMPPFRFPEDYPEAEQDENVVELFLRKILENHNKDVAAWQKLKLGTVTVRDPNNYIARSSDEYLSTWDVLKDKLFESSLGGYLVSRYEADGTYIDYLSELPLTNVQHITFGDNLLDVLRENDANTTYTAVLPLGKESEHTEGENGEGKQLSIIDLPDGDITDDLVKSGAYIWSRSGREKYGWMCAPVDDTTWDDVTVAENLQTKAVDYLVASAMRLSRTITINAIDLHFTDPELQSFRVGRNVVVNASDYGLHEAVYPLVSLEIDLLNPQNTIITIGDTVRTMIDQDAQHQQHIKEQLNKQHAESRKDITEVRTQVRQQSTQIISDCQQIIFGALDNYVETGSFDEYRQQVESQFSIMAEEMAMKFTQTVEQIVDINGDMQSQFNQLYKYIKFSGNGISITSGDSKVELVLDNEQGIVFRKNGVPFGYWDGVDFHTGNIIIEVNKRAQFGNFAFFPRSDGTLTFNKVR